MRFPNLLRAAATIEEAAQPRVVENENGSFFFMTSKFEYDEIVAS